MKDGRKELPSLAIVCGQSEPLTGAPGPTNESSVEGDDGTYTLGLGKTAWPGQPPVSCKPYYMFTISQLFLSALCSALLEAGLVCDSTAGPHLPPHFHVSPRMA